ncbi:MAG TPA: S26 family signal peptidase [Bryobacteraceae bacterium]|nr:S26 family signal peptidase [Bryobacteraceae bacterium]
MIGDRGWGQSVLPYRDVERGYIVAFRYPEDIEQICVKRVIGIKGTVSDRDERATRAAVD